jgi:hypothetical protein
VTRVRLARPRPGGADRAAGMLVKYAALFWPAVAFPGAAFLAVAAWLAFLACAVLLSRCRCRARARRQRQAAAGPYAVMRLTAPANGAPRNREYLPGQAGTRAVARAMAARDAGQPLFWGPAGARGLETAVAVRSDGTKVGYGVRPVTGPRS